MTSFFTITETGDPFGSTWDATEYPSQEAYERGDYGIFRGDLGYRFDRDELIVYLRKEKPGCTIYDEDGEEWLHSIRMG